MHYTCALKGLEFFAHHGLYPEEQIIGGKFMVDLTLEFQIPDHSPLNKLEEVANYELLFSIVQQTMQEKEALIETVAKKILDRVQKEFTDTITVEVSITKPNPAGLFKSGSAVVRLKR